MWEEEKEKKRTCTEIRDTCLKKKKKKRLKCVSGKTRLVWTRTVLHAGVPCGESSTIVAVYSITAVQ